MPVDAEGCLEIVVRSWDDALNTTLCTIYLVCSLGFQFLALFPSRCYECDSFHGQGAHLASHSSIDCSSMESSLHHY